MSPFKAVYCREPPALLRYENGSTKVADLEFRLKERDAMLQLLKQHLLRAQQLMKTRADGQRRHVEFAVGDLVYLKLKRYRQQSLARRSNEKLSARYYGPYPIEARMGEVAYKLTLPEKSKVHPTFHVSQLKAAIESSMVPTPLPPQLNVEGILEAVPETVLATRVNQRTGQEELLIKWKGLPDHDNSWEWKGVIEDQFPDLNLEDKVCFKGGGIDTSGRDRPVIIHQYRRKKNLRRKATDVGSKECNLTADGPRG